jgi:hypothetical protein
LIAFLALAASDGCWRSVKTVLLRRQQVLWQQRQRLLTGYRFMISTGDSRISFRLIATIVAVPVRAAKGIGLPQFCLRGPALLQVVHPLYQFRQNSGSPPIPNSAKVKPIFDSAVLQVIERTRQSTPRRRRGTTCSGLAISRWRSTAHSVAVRCQRHAKRGWQQTRARTAV